MGPKPDKIVIIITEASVFTFFPYLGNGTDKELATSERVFSTCDAVTEWACREMESLSDRASKAGFLELAYPFNLSKEVVPAKGVPRAPDGSRGLVWSVTSF